MFVLSQLFSADPFRAGVDVKDGESELLCFVSLNLSYQSGRFHCDYLTVPALCGRQCTQHCVCALFWVASPEKRRTLVLLTVIPVIDVRYFNSLLSNQLRSVRIG